MRLPYNHTWVDNMSSHIRYIHRKGDTPADSTLLMLAIFCVICLNIGCILYIKRLNIMKKWKTLLPLFRVYNRNRDIYDYATLYSRGFLNNVDVQ